MNISEAIELAEKIILSNLKDRPDPNQLMSATGMRFKVLNEYFKKKHGMSIIDYWLKERMAAATAMLGQGLYSVKKVAEAYGFYNDATFGKAFRKVNKLSPTEFLIQHLTEDALIL
jgi:methylphosphotriester-DNA--protein-cysteine methyltransferase